MRKEALPGLNVRRVLQVLLGQEGGPQCKGSPVVGKALSLPPNQATLTGLSLCVGRRTLRSFWAHLGKRERLCRWVVDKFFTRNKVVVYMKWNKYEMHTIRLLAIASFSIWREKLLSPYSGTGRPRWIFGAWCHIETDFSVLRRGWIDTLSDAAVNVTQRESSQTSKGASCFLKLREGVPGEEQVRLKRMIEMTRWISGSVTLCNRWVAGIHLWREVGEGGDRMDFNETSVITYYCTYGWDGRWEDLSWSDSSSIWKPPRGWLQEHPRNAPRQKSHYR